MSTQTKSYSCRHGLDKLVAFALPAFLFFVVLIADSVRETKNLQAAQLLGVAWGAGPYRIDSNTGITVPVGDLTGGHFNSMARNSFDVFLVSDNSNHLFRVDPTSGSMDMEVSVTGFGVDESIRGMAFDNDDRLFAVVGTPFRDDIDRLFEIDLSNGNATLIGATGMLGLQSLAVASDGTLYSFDIAGNGQGLATIDPSTGIATDINPLVDEQGSGMQSLSFSHDGILYGMGNLNAIYTVDTSNGELTELAPISIDIRGMEFLPIPEPNSLFLTIFALISLGWLRKSQVGHS